MPRHLTLDLPGAIIPLSWRQRGSVVERLIRRRRLSQENEAAKTVAKESVNADIAQLVEQVIRNDQVVGSNPTIGSLNKPLSLSVLR